VTEAHSISQALASLILRDDIPLKTIAIVGEIIRIDARLRQYDQGPTKRTTGDELALFLETYDALLQRTKCAVAEFLKTQDREPLLRMLQDIRDALVALY
jgi:hypothetical protein